MWKPRIYRYYSISKGQFYWTTDQPITIGWHSPTMEDRRLFMEAYRYCQLINLKADYVATKN